MPYQLQFWKFTSKIYFGKKIGAEKEALLSSGQRGLTEAIKAFQFLVLCMTL